MTGGVDAIRGVGKLKAAVAVVVLLVGSVGGAYAAGVIGMPSVSGVENRFAAADNETTTIDSQLDVRNPNFFAIGLGGVSVNYTVELNEVRFAQGDKRGINLSTGNASLTFRTVMSNGQIPPWWIAHISDGESSDLVVNARVHSSTLGRSTTLTPVNREINTDLLSAFNSEEARPVNANQPVVSDPVLYINETSAQWGSVSEEQTPIQMTFGVYNPKTTPYTITALGYDITMNGVPVGGGEIEKGATIPGKASRTIDAVTVIRNEELDTWWATHLQRNQVTDLKIEFYAKVDLGTGQPVRVPLDALTYTETMETDIFGNKNETGGAAAGTATPMGDGGSGGGDGTAGATTDADDGSSTTDDGATLPTSTATESGGSGGDTATPTATETDGGLLG